MSSIEISKLFGEARTHYAWQQKPVTDEQLHHIFDLMQWPPTGGNGQTLRIAFVRTAESRELVKPALQPQNVEKMMTAPVTAVLAYDAAWYKQMARLAPSRPEAQARIEGLPEAARDKLGWSNGWLAAGYFILAARTIGLDCGPMGGFDPAKVDAALFPDGAWRSFLLVNLGYGDPAKTFPRQPRLTFDEVCKLI